MYLKEFLWKDSNMCLIFLGFLASVDLLTTSTSSGLHSYIDCKVVMSD